MFFIIWQKNGDQYIYLKFFDNYILKDSSVNNRSIVSAYKIVCLVLNKYLSFCIMWISIGIVVSLKFAALMLQV